MDLPTVRVKHPEVEGGVMIINESDYDPAIHQPVDDASARRCEALDEARAATAKPYSLDDFKRELRELAATDPRTSTGGDATGTETAGSTGGVNFIDGGTAQTGSPNEQGASTDPLAAPTVGVDAARQARVAELGGLSFVELKEKCADLGFTVVPVGTSKVDLIAKIMELEAKAPANAESPGT